MKFNQNGKDQSVYIVAEVGNNHEGNFNLATELIGLAAQSGADAVKFQTVEPELFITSSNKDRIDQLNRFKLSYEQFRKLSQVASNEGIDFISTPLDIKSAKFLNELLSTFKISSGDNDFYALIETIASFGKNIILSTGLSTIKELKHSVDIIQKVWHDSSSVAELALLHCVSSYPVPPDQANLSMIHRLKSEFDGVTIGYSDHTIGIEAAVASVACGAMIVEKHFTIDKNYSTFRDHQLSSDPEELKIMVQRIRETELLLGDYNAEIMEVENEIRSSMRRSLAAAEDLNQGHIICERDILWVRPGTGFKPGEEAKILGKKISRSIEKGHLFKPEDII